MNGICRQLLSSLCLPAWPVGARKAEKCKTLSVGLHQLITSKQLLYTYSNGFCPNQLAPAHRGTIEFFYTYTINIYQYYTENIEKSRAGSIGGAGFIGGAGSITRKNILLRV